jgi:hypothetical protein
VSLRLQWVVFGSAARAFRARHTPYSKAAAWTAREPQMSAR